MQSFSKHEAVLVDPAPVRAWRSLFNNPRLAWIWIPVRFYLALMWLAAGLHKLFAYQPVPGDVVGLQGIAWGTVNPGWMGNGDALKTFWTKAVKMDPQPVITFDWYRSFLQYLLDTHSYSWFAKLVVFSELAVGLLLLVGAFVGLAAGISCLMNLNYLLAGSNSLNPVMLPLALVLVLAWKTAGWYGLDRLLYPLLGIRQAIRRVESRHSPTSDTIAASPLMPPEPVERK